MKILVLAKNRDTSEVGWEMIPTDVKNNVASRIVQTRGKDPQFLKAGSMGSIYLLSTGNILKITSDESEAAAAEIIRDNPSPLMYPVMDVFEIQAGSPIFGLLLARLQPADPEWEEFGDIFNNWHSMMTNALDEKHPDKHTQIYLAPPVMDVFKRFMARTYGSNKFKEQLKWLQGVTEYLLKNEIKFLDVHGGNIMKNPETNEHVLIDLGYSETPEVELPRVTASVNRFIVAKNLIIISELLSHVMP
jgi:hypothetical protein